MKIDTDKITDMGIAAIFVGIGVMLIVLAVVIALEEISGCRNWITIITN